jgi:UPF0271 protein
MSDLTIDLNCDLGEGFGPWWTAEADFALLDVVSSANIACGFHAGDSLIMSRVCAAAVERSVTIGAHVGYRDLHGFGRRPLSLRPGELRADVLYQVGALEGIARAGGGAVRYVKPHGALYNTAAEDAEVAAEIVAAVADFDPQLVLLGLPGSVLLESASRKGLRTRSEGFADRAYTRRGTLVPRSRAGSVLHDPETVTRRATDLATGTEITADDGSAISLLIDSLCLHSDTPGAVALAGAIRQKLETTGIAVRSFA